MARYTLLEILRVESMAHDTHTCQSNSSLDQAKFTTLFRSISALDSAIIQNALSSNPERMRLSIKHKLILPIRLNLPGTILGKNQIQILQRLGDPETLHHREMAAAILLQHIMQARKPVFDAARLVQCDKGIPGDFLPFRVPGGTVGVVDRLEHFGAQDVCGGGGPEAGLVVEGGVL